MKAVKRLVWGLPIAAMAVGAFALTGGATGAMTGPDLPAPIVVAAATEAEVPAGVDGQVWEEMARKRAGQPLVRVNGRLQVVFKGSARGF